MSTSETQENFSTYIEERVFLVYKVDEEEGTSYYVLKFRGVNWANDEPLEICFDHGFSDVDSNTMVRWLFSEKNQPIVSSEWMLLLAICSILNIELRPLLRWISQEIKKHSST